jgi:hypothetical protein
MDRVASGVEIQPGPGRQAKRVGAVHARQRPGRADARENRPKLADDRAQCDVPRGRPLGAPQVVGEIDMRRGLVDGGQADEEPTRLPAAEGPLPHRLAVRTRQRDTCREIDPEGPDRTGPWLQRFANHAG